MFEQYLHHGKMVWVKTLAKGKHHQRCLCLVPCKKFKPGAAENCPIAQATFDNCVKFNTVTPMYECPEFEA